MQHLKVGVAYEGGLDTKYLETLIHRILIEKDFQISTLEMVKPDTGIVKFVPAYVIDFQQKGIDLMIFVTDRDEEESRRNQVIEGIRKIDGALLDFCAIGIPNPHIEKWIITDQDTVKNILNLSGDSALGFSHLKPKQQLMSLHKTSDYEGTLEEAKVLIAESCNIQAVCANDSDFNTFKQEIDKTLNFITTTRR